MRLVTFEQAESNKRHVGAVYEGAIVPVNEEVAPQSMLELIESDGVSRLTSPAKSMSEVGIPIDDVRLCAPIPRPTSNIICLGRNYREHAAESARAWNEAVKLPTFFTKAVTSVIGPHDDIPFDPQLSTEIDWEVELAVMLGRRAKHVRAEDALDYIFGYTVLNDVSARDLQNGYGGQFFYGKSLDGSCPMGPWIVTAEDVSDPQDLTLRLCVNGITKQEASTREMIHGVAEIVEILSRGMTLEPGQIIATGTPAGVGFARNPPEFLKPGDVVEAEIAGIGAMRNRVVQVPAR